MPYLFCSVISWRSLNSVNHSFLVWPLMELWSIVVAIVFSICLTLSQVSFWSMEAHAGQSPCSRSLRTSWITLSMRTEISAVSSRALRRPAPMLMSSKGAEEMDCRRTLQTVITLITPECGAEDAIPAGSCRDSGPRVNNARTERTVWWMMNSFRESESFSVAKSKLVSNFEEAQKKK